MTLPNSDKTIVISQDYADLLTPGVVVEVSHDEAEELGAFLETALDEEDALESMIDLESV